MSDTGIIYKVTSPSGKVYIGQTIKTLDQRRREHLFVATHPKYPSFNLPICRAIREYKDKLQWEVLYQNVPIDKLDIAEMCGIYTYDSFGEGYNCTPGGDFNPSKVPEIAARIGLKSRERMTGYRPSDEMRRMQSIRCSGSLNPMFGRTHTQEARRKIREARLGKFTRKGYQHSLESKQKMSLARVGKVLTKEHRENMSKRQLTLNRPGKPVSQYSVEGIWIQDFSTLNAAARYIRNNSSYNNAAPSEIRVACQKSSSVRYGFKWRFKEI